MAVRSDLIGAGRLTGADDVALDVVPTGQTWIIKQVSFWSSGVDTNGWYLYVVRTGTLDADILEWSEPSAGQRIHVMSGRFHVAEQGDEIRCQVGGAGSFTVSGAKLAGVAP